jgi:hypothetical protein
MPVTVRIFFKNDKQSQAAKYTASEAVESGVAVSFRGEKLAAKYVPVASKPKPSSHPQPASELEPVLEPTLEPEPAPEPAPERALEPTPEPAPVSEHEPQPAPQPAPAPEPEPELQHASQPELEPEPEPEPEPQREPEPQPEPQPELQLNPEPEPLPIPEPSKQFAGGEGQALGEQDDVVLQAADPGFVEVHFPMKETDGEFGAKDGFAMYVDGARFVPESLAVTNVTVTALSRDLRQQGVARMTGLVYGTDPVCPGFGFRHVYRCDW